jgi:hypothetical protein
METTETHTAVTFLLRTRTRTYTNTFLISYNNSKYQYMQSSIFGTTGNVILLIVIICNKDMRTVPIMYVLNFPISDMINLTVLISEAWANKISDTWLHVEFMCKFLWPSFVSRSVRL